MSRIPRILPLVAVAIGGVLTINALAGARSLPDLLASAKAFAEEAAKPAGKIAAKLGAKTDAKADAKVAAKSGETDAKAATGSAPSAADAAMPALNLIGATAAPPTGGAPVCAPSAAELAREAGLSPAELQMLQSLGVRRGQLDEREASLDVQLKLLAAAEAKIDAKLAQMTGLKGDIKTLLGQVDAQQDAETQRLVRVYEAMKPKDAAVRLAILSDPVRLPIAAKMKERGLSAVLGYMPPAAARELTEKLAQRYASSKLADAKAAVNGPATPAAGGPATAQPASAVAPAATPTPDPTAKPAPVKPKARPKAKPKPKPAAPDPKDAAAPMAVAPS